MSLMTEYSKIKSGKLILKGEKSKKKYKHKKKSKNSDKEEESIKPTKDGDTAAHGGWWEIEKVSHMTGSVAIEFGIQTYVKALDNGLFTLGAPHDEGDGPSPEEILTAIPVNNSKIALKSGYDKYLRVDSNGTVMGRSDAVGSMEQWEPVFQDGSLALLGCNNCFMSVDDEEDAILALKKSASPSEMVKMRSMAQKEEEEESSTGRKRKELPEEEVGSVTDIEINYVRKFQKFQDKKLRLNQDGKEQLEDAKNKGELHELLLDRRSKMKADRYCK